ncbi:MAG: L-threonylcarbamoyladenylate synthase [Myxococcota bacterium]
MSEHTQNPPRVLRVTDLDADQLAHALLPAAEVLRRGGLVAFPTETVYGLGADGLDADAVRKIFAAKGRPANNPLILHVTDEKHASSLSATWPERAQALADACWPGPLTLVLARSSVVPDAVTAGGPTVAVRAPAHPVARALIELAGRPLAAPSANRYTQVSPTLADHVVKGLGARVEIVVDAGPARVGLESTILSLAHDPPRILRPGTIQRARIEEILGVPVGYLDDAVDDDAPAMMSPGLARKHYAPSARVVLLGEDGATWEALCEASRPTALGAIVTRAPVPAGVHTVRLEHTPEAVARGLYAALHELDELGCAVIAVQNLPDDEAWRAVHNRLSRAVS